MVTIGIIENDPIVRTELVEMLCLSKKLDCKLVADSIDSFLRRISTSLDIILMDIDFFGITGLEAIPRLLDKSPQAEIVILSSYDHEDNIFHALRFGASGYLLKESPLQNLEQSLIAVKKGIPALSPPIARKMIAYFREKSVVKSQVKLKEKETAVLKLLVDGLSYKLIANELNISINGIRYHVKNIYKKLHINSRPELMTLYIEGRIPFFE